MLLGVIYGFAHRIIGKSVITEWRLFNVFALLRFMLISPTRRVVAVVVPPQRSFQFNFTRMLDDLIHEEKMCRVIAVIIAYLNTFLGS